VISLNGVDHRVDHGVDSVDPRLSPFCLGPWVCTMRSFLPPVVSGPPLDPTEVHWEHSTLEHKWAIGVAPGWKAEHMQERLQFEIAQVWAGVAGG
jgi:hypothetical protein